MTPDEIRELVNTSVREVLTNANRYGLTWRRLPATVVDGSDLSAVLVRFDGSDDTAGVPAVSFIGGISPGDRIMVDVVPPSGAYIVGRMPATPTPGYQYFATLVYTTAATTEITPTTLLGARGVRQRLWGGGGGGGGCAATGAGAASVGAGGGGGGYSESFIDLADFTSGTIVVGAGGTAGPTANNGGNGGDTTGLDWNGAATTGAGGGGGEGDTGGSSGAVSTAGGSGGGAAGMITINGSDGGNGVRAGGFVGSQGFGGGAGAGAGSRRGTGNNAAGPGLDGRVYGGGGSGGNAQASQAAQTGGAGAVGMAVLDLYF